MASRALLRSQIVKAWRLTIIKDYERINSERSLQAALWSRLNRTLPPKTRRLFIEPKMTVMGTPRYPDIVICNTRQVIGIIELKFKPRAVASWRNDLKKFRAIAGCKTRIAISHDRYRAYSTRW